MSYNHLFQTINEFTAAYNGEDYKEPWVSFTIESSGLAYNKKDSPVPPVDYTGMPFTIEITSGSEGSITFNRAGINYRKNDGEWVTDDNPTVSVSSGDKIQVKQDYTAPGGGGSGSGSNNGSGAGSGAGSGSGNDPQLFSADSSLMYIIYGNIMSIYQEEGFENLTSFTGGEEEVFTKLFSGREGLVSAENLVLPATALTNWCYQWMFSGCTALTAAPALPATTLAYACYIAMFDGCTSLTTAPALPATTLTGSCYQEMFAGCASLTTAPTILPATTLTEYCYYGMFSGCTSLSTSPELPATTLAENCYGRMFRGTNALPDCSNIDFTSQTVVQSRGLNGLFYGTKVTDSDLFNILPINQQTGKYWLPVTVLSASCYEGMFEGCTSLTTAPELPATTLTNDCYKHMFDGCTGLTSAPVLPATTLVRYCYYGMFSGCTNLNYIKCLATSISSYNCTVDWVNGVASSGTFVTPQSTSWTTGNNGIPTNWTRENAS